MSIKIFIVLTAIFAVVQMQQDWWKTASFYQIYPRSFMDSNGDGIGDIKGIISRMEHLKDAGMTACWLSPIFKSPQVDTGYDVSDFYTIEPDYGIMSDFDELLSKARELGIKVMLDFIPNHTSDQHVWFEKSVNSEANYTNYYVWRDPKIGTQGERLPPTNWVSVFGGPAWTYNEKRNQYYLHQFSPQQPDLNYRNPEVVSAMQAVLEYYMNRGVAGFRLDAINHMFEDEEFRDEPRNMNVDDPEDYEYLLHIHTKDLPETFDLVYSWRKVIDGFVQFYNVPYDIILMTEAYASTSDTMRYYRNSSGTPGAHMPFNFQLIFNFHHDAKAQDIKNGIDEWLNNMPAGEVADWVAGSHDHSRVATRVGEEKIHMVNTVVLTLPGASITYYGEEIGMHDYLNFVQKDHRDKNRTPMQWDSSYAGGFTTKDMSETWLPIHPNYVSINVETQKTQATSTYNYFKSVTSLRKEKAFAEGNFNLQVINEWVLAYTRELAGETGYLIVINLANHEQNVNLSTLSTFPNSMWVVTASPFSKFYVGQLALKANVTLSSYDAVIFSSSVVEELTTSVGTTNNEPDTTTVGVTTTTTAGTTTTTGAASHIYVSLFVMIAAIFSLINL